MRAISRSSLFVLLASCAIGLAAAACNDSSNMVSGPAVAQPPAADLTGNWSGTFHSDSKGCSSAPINASLSQSGAAVSGHIVASGCGIDGHFVGTLQGNLLQGAVKMPGCNGGAVTGTLSGSTLNFQIGDMVKNPGTGPDGVAAAGGNVTMQR